MSKIDTSPPGSDGQPVPYRVCLDYSFKELRQVSELGNELPRNMPLGSGSGSGGMSPRLGCSGGVNGEGGLGSGEGGGGGGVENSNGGEGNSNGNGNATGSNSDGVGGGASDPNGSSGGANQIGGNGAGGPNAAQGSNNMNQNNNTMNNNTMNLNLSPGGSGNTTLALGPPGNLSPNSLRKLRFRRHVVGLRLNNNLIDSLNNVGKQLKSIPRSPVPDPEFSLLWLDVSFCQLTSIHPSIVTELPALKTFYCHANKLNNLACMEKLSKMENLTSITSNGNPFESKKYYRAFMIGALGNGVRSIDHTTITKDERKMGNEFYKNYCIGRIAWQERKQEQAEMRAAQGF